MKKKIQKQNKGFTIFIAVVLMSILLLISFAVVNISLKEIILATVGKESQKAFYVSDIGLECALYWDYKKSAFPIEGGANGVSCNGTEPVFSVDRNENNIDETKYFATTTMSFEFPNNRCVDVTVIKNTKDYNTENPDTSTIIESRGYNTCDKENIRRVERAVRVKY